MTFEAERRAAAERPAAVDAEDPASERMGPGWAGQSGSTGRRPGDWSAGEFGWQPVEPVAGGAAGSQRGAGLATKTAVCPGVRVGGGSRPVRVSGMRCPPRLGRWVRPGAVGRNPGQLPTEVGRARARPRAGGRPRAEARGDRRAEADLSPSRLPLRGRRSRAPVWRPTATGEPSPGPHRARPPAPTSQPSAVLVPNRIRRRRQPRPTITRPDSATVPTAADGISLAETLGSLGDRGRRVPSPDRRRLGDRGSRLPPAVGERPRRHRAGWDLLDALGSGRARPLAHRPGAARPRRAGGRERPWRAAGPNPARPDRRSSLAAILIGLLWPYLFEVFERFVGVWLVLAGTIVLAAGGLLGLRRHDPGGAVRLGESKRGPRPGPCYTAPDAGPPPGGRIHRAARRADGRTEAGAQPHGPDLQRDRRCRHRVRRQPGRPARHPGDRRLPDRPAGSPAPTGRSATCSSAAEPDLSRTSLRAS